MFYTRYVKSCGIDLIIKCSTSVIKGMSYLLLMQNLIVSNMNKKKHIRVDCTDRTAFHYLLESILHEKELKKKKKCHS